MPEIPSFARGRRWHKRASRARALDQRVFHDLDDDYEYWPDPRVIAVQWHQIDWRHNQYRDVDPETGDPVRGSEGQWRPLK